MAEVEVGEGVEDECGGVVEMFYRSCVKFFITGFAEVILHRFILDLSHTVFNYIFICVAGWAG